MKIIVFLLAVTAISGCSYPFGRSAEERERDEKMAEVYVRGAAIMQQEEIKQAREERERQKLEKASQTCTWPAWLCGS